MNEISFCYSVQAKWVEEEAERRGNEEQDRGRKRRREKETNPGLEPGRMKVLWVDADLRELVEEHGVDVRRLRGPCCGEGGGTREVRERLTGRGGR